MQVQALEESFSDFVAGHLQDDLKARGIIINREVQIRRSLPRTEGQKTDVRVDAIKRDAKMRYMIS